MSNQPAGSKRKSPDAAFDDKGEPEFCGQTLDLFALHSVPRLCSYLISIIMSSRVKNALPNKPSYFTKRPVSYLEVASNQMLGGPDR